MSGQLVQNHQRSGVGVRAAKGVASTLSALFLGKPRAADLRFSEASNTQTARRSSKIMSMSSLSSHSPPEPPKHKKIVDIHVPSELFLRRQITAPKASLKSIESVALLDLQRKTPFATNDIKWAITEPVLSDEHVLATQWVAKLSDLDTWRENLFNHGFLVRRVFVADEGTLTPIVDFSNKIAPHSRRWQAVNAALTACAAILALFIAVYPSYVLRSENMQLDALKAELEQEVIALSERLELVRQRDRDRAEVFDAIYHRPILVNTIRELTVALPDNVWIDSYRSKDGMIFLSGEIDGSAADLVLSLSKNRKLENPQLVGQITRSRSGQERFEMSVQGKGGGL